MKIEVFLKHFLISQNIVLWWNRDFSLKFGDIEHFRRYLNFQRYWNKNKLFSSKICVRVRNYVITARFLEYFDNFFDIFSKCDHLNLTKKIRLTIFPRERNFFWDFLFLIKNNKYDSKRCFFEVNISQNLSNRFLYQHWFRIEFGIKQKLQSETSCASLWYKNYF